MVSNGLDGVHGVPKRWCRGVQGVPASEFRTFWVKKGCCVGFDLSCLGRVRGQKGVPEGLPLRRLERFRGQKGVPEGVSFRCLGRFRGQKGVPGGYLFIV